MAMRPSKILRRLTNSLLLRPTAMKKLPCSMRTVTLTISKLMARETIPCSWATSSQQRLILMLEATTSEVSPFGTVSSTSLTH